MELVVLEAAFGFDVAYAFLLADGEDAVGDGPFGGGVILGGDPLVEVLAVEEDDGVGGWIGVGFAGGDDRRDGFVDFGVFVFWRGSLLGGEGGGNAEENEGG